MAEPGWNPELSPPNSRVKATFPEATTLCMAIANSNRRPKGPAPQSQQDLLGDISEFGSCPFLRTQAGRYLGDMVDSCEAPQSANTPHYRWGSRDPRREGACPESAHLRSPARTGGLCLLTSFPTLHKWVKRQSLPSKDLVQIPAL